MLILTILISILNLISSLDLTIVDYGESITVPLQPYFNHTLESSDLGIDDARSNPNNIASYFSFGIHNRQLYQTIFVQMSHTIENKTFNLNEHQIMQTLSIVTQPLKIFLTSDTLMMVIFDDQLKDQPILLSTLNLSAEANKALNCRQLAYNSQYSQLYIQCIDIVKNSSLIVLVGLYKDINSIVNAMKYLKSYSTAAYLTECDQVKIFYIYDDIINNQIISNQLFMYCPYSNNRAEQFTMISVDAECNNDSYVTVYNYSCQASCCYSAEMIIHRPRQLVMLTNTSMQLFRLPTCISILSYQDFISVRVGSTLEAEDIYILTKQYFYIKYPKLTNEQKIDITSENMSPMGFTVTKNYIIIQLLNDITKQTILKVYKIVDYNPKLIGSVKIDDKSQILIGTQNYLQTADYMYLFTNSTNTLSTAYYQGPQLIITPIANFSNQKIFTAVVVDNNPVSLNESLQINITVYNFNNSDYFIDYEQLKYVFEESFVKIPLRDGVVGPLVEFYTIDKISLQREFLNGMYLIDMEKAMVYEDNVSNIVGIILERNENQSTFGQLMIRFAQKHSITDEQREAGENQYIFLHDCNLLYNISVFEINKCNNLTTKIINQSLISLSKMKGFFYIQNGNDLNYLLYDKDTILFCNDTVCIKKERPGYQDPLKLQAIKVLNGPDVSLLVLRNDSKSIILFSLGNMNAVTLIQRLQINETKLVDLSIPSVIIVDFFIDWQSQSFLIVHLNNSKVFIIQKQTDPDTKDRIISHATNLIQVSNVSVCRQFVKVFYVTSTTSKIVILCVNQSEYHLVEFTINNLFDVKKTREYPLYDYKVYSNSSKHFSDRQFIYIAVTGKQPQYLVYNTLEITPNILMYKIPTNSDFSMPGRIRNETKSRGFGIIDKWAFVASNSYYQGELQFENSNLKIQTGNASFAVRNNKDQLSLVKFDLTINLTKSILEYNDRQQYRIEQQKDNQDIQYQLDLSQLKGPLQMVEFAKTCELWPISIKKEELFEKGTCVSKEGNQTNSSEWTQNTTLGTFFDHTTLNNSDLVITSTALICIINKTILSSQKMSYSNCTISNFSNIVQNQALLICLASSETYLFQMVKVSSTCEMTIAKLNFPPGSKYFNFKANYPYVVIESPILLPQNKNYYSCLFDPKTESLNRCTMLIYGYQNHFLSVDYDVLGGYGLILEKGIGIFKLSFDNDTLNATNWIKQQQLKNLGISPPYKYVKFISISQNGQQMIIQVANNIIAYEIYYDFKKPSIHKIYQQYVGCSNINFKSININKFKVMICQFLTSSVQILDETVPIKPLTQKYAQFYLTQSYENFPVSMFEIDETSLLYLSQNQILQINTNVDLCYYILRQNITWTLNFNTDIYNQICETTLELTNHHSQLSHLIKFYVEKPSPITVKDIVLMCIAHLPFVILLIAFPIIKKCAKREKKSVPNFSIKKATYNKNFYSNDFQDKLKDLNQSLADSKL